MKSIVDPFQTLFKYFPSVAKKYEDESVERKTDLSINQLTKIYRRIKNINGLMLSDQQMKRLKTYLQTKQYQNEQTPFPYSLVQRQHDGIMRQMKYTPQQHNQVVSQKLQKLIKTIGQTLNIQSQIKQMPFTTKQKKSSQILQLMPTKNIKQRFDSVGNLVYDKQLLDLISKKCLLNENDEIIILDDFQPQRRYVDYGNKFEGENYYLIYNVNRKPVSQIQYGLISENSEDNSVDMKISSDTDINERNKHYNTILRAVLIILSPTMMLGYKPVVRIQSDAQNPFSVYSLLKLGFSYQKEHNITAGPDEEVFDVSWFTPSLKKTQTAQQTQKRTQQQKKLFTYIDNVWEWDPDYFEIPMYLTKENFPRAVRLAKNTLYKLRKCVIQGI